MGECEEEYRTDTVSEMHLFSAINRYISVYIVVGWTSESSERGSESWMRGKEKNLAINMIYINEPAPQFEMWAAVDSA